MIPALLISMAIAPAAPAEAATRLTVRPMAAPKPALRYQLLPEVRELSPGNSVQWYLRCFAEQRNFFFGKQGVEERDRYRKMPLAELAKENLQTYGGGALTQADWGARLDTAEWDVLRKVQTDGTELRVPELASLRILGIALQVRFRAAVAREDYDTAIRTAKTMFGLARHLGESPALEANRLGLEIAELALDTFEEMLQQPNAPNLYWAYTDLPTPLVDLRKGFQGNRVLVDTELSSLRTDAAMTDEQLEQLLSKLSGRIGFVREQAGRSPKNVRVAFQARVEDRERVARIRTRLLNESKAEGVLEKVSAFKVMGYPALQLILIDERSEFETRRDELLKLLALAPWQIDALTKGDPNRGDGLFADFLPGVVEHRRSQARLEQRIALLRTIEAIRLYAAKHEGNLPEKLEAIAVPVPVDPFTGKAFGYSVEGNVVQLIGDGKSYEVSVK